MRAAGRVSGCRAAPPYLATCACRPSSASDSREMLAARCGGSAPQATQPSVAAVKTLLSAYAARGQLEFYIDLHAHANKKGVFIFGAPPDRREARAAVPSYECVHSMWSGE